MLNAPIRMFPGLLLAAIPALCQAPRSPIVNPDRSVTFTLSAPLASKVYLGGEFDDKYNRPPGALMTKDASGLWTYTTAPLEPGIYYYGFNVDGLFAIDPSNSRYRPFIRQTPLNNLLEVPGDTPAPWVVTSSTPRGAVQIEEYFSQILNRFANAYVYTPPGYSSQPSRQYPVLYLLHGASTGELGDTAREWFFAGYANRIMDNLIAQGMSREMIVVMLDSQTPNNSANLSLLASYELFEKYLIDEWIPLVESRYRVDPSKSSRWIAGLSRGGGQALHVAFRNPDRFSALGMFSIPLPATFPDAYPAIDPATLSGQIPVIYYTCGSTDSDQGPGYERGVSALLDRGIRFDQARFSGGHIWHVWRYSLAEFVSRLK